MSREWTRREWIDEALAHQARMNQVRQMRLDALWLASARWYSVLIFWVMAVEEVRKR